MKNDNTGQTPLFKKLTKKSYMKGSIEVDPIEVVGLYVASIAFMAIVVLLS